MNKSSSMSNRKKCPECGGEMKLIEDLAKKMPPMVKTFLPSIARLLNRLEVYVCKNCGYIKMYLRKE